MFDKSTFAKIIKDIKETYSSQEEFSKKSGIGRTYLSQYMNMKLDDPPKPKILEKLAKSSNGITTYYELMSICDYIRTGDLFSDEIEPSLAQSYRDAFIEYGISPKDVSLIEKLSKSDSVNKDKEIADILYKYPSKTLQRVFSTLNVCRQNLSSEIEFFAPLKKALKKLQTDYIYPLYTENTVAVPILGMVKAGYNYLAQENWISTIDVDKSLVGDSKDFFALKVKGDSMSPALIEDDIVIIKKQDDFENGDIVVAIVNGDEATIKKGKKTENSILLQPLNPNYEPLIFTKDEMKSIPVIIVGIVKQLKREF